MEQVNDKNNPKKKTTTFKKILIIVVTLVSVIGLTIALLFKLTPWPASLMIRYAFTKGAEQTNDALLKYVPSGITLISNQQYAPNDSDAFLDVYYPSNIANKDTKLPVIVWIHGGGWVSGTKEEGVNYYKILASRGFVVVSIGYSIAPEMKYPTPVKQANAALAYLKVNAHKFHINPLKFFIAGDSAGAHIAAQVANVISSSAYSDLLQIVPSIDRSQLAGMLLYCGAYDVTMVKLDGDFGGFLQTVLWAYSGTKEFKNAPFFKVASVIDYVDSNFPTSFISVGNADPLQQHSLNLARKLSKLEVEIDTIFYSKDYKPGLPHEYQFNLDTDAGKEALKQSVEFINRTSSRN